MTEFQDSAPAPASTDSASQNDDPQPGHPAPSSSASVTTSLPAEATQVQRVGWKKIRPLGYGLLGSVGALVLVTGFYKPGFLVVRELDVHAAGARVRQVLTDPYIGYGATEVTEVRCNDGRNPTIKIGATFTCKTTIAGSARIITAKFIDRSGSYTIGAPS